jgi:predicted small secreted protein
VFGQVALWALVGAYGLLLAVPIVLLLRLPAPLIPPSADDPAAVERYQRDLVERLEKNPRLAGQPLESRAEIEAAIDQLEAEADAVISSTAGSVFVSTAISQYGRLDAFVVLAAQTRMVWHIAHIFYQRPTLRDMLQLYANVGSTVFIASEIDDVDIAEQVEPMIQSVLGSVITAVPGAQALTGVIVNSALTGSANAFLTLRVGVITRTYCAAIVEQEKRAVKRSATIEAARLLRRIATPGTRAVARAILGASKGKMLGALDTAKTGVVGASGKVVDAGSSAAAGVGRGVKSAGEAVIEAAEAAREAGEALIDASENAVRDAGRGLKSAGDKVADAGESVARKVARRDRRSELPPAQDDGLDPAP